MTKLSIGYDISINELQDMISFGEDYYADGGDGAPVTASGVQTIEGKDLTLFDFMDMTAKFPETRRFNSEQIEEIFEYGNSISWRTSEVNGQTFGEFQNKNMPSMTN